MLVKGASFPITCSPLKDLTGISIQPKWTPKLRSCRARCPQHHHVTAGGASGSPPPAAWHDCAVLQELEGFLASDA